MILTRRLFVNKILIHIRQSKFKYGDFVPLFEHAKKFPEKIAIHDQKGSYSYGNIYINAKELSNKISKELGGKIHERVLFLCSNDVNYVTTLWAIWMSGQTAIPLSSQHPENILNYYAQDTNSKLIVSTPGHAELTKKLSKNSGAHFYIIDDDLLGENRKETVPKDLEIETMPPEIYEYNSALILYTSGTTGNPKGVVVPHKNLFHQIETLTNAWRWSPKDVMLHSLPLYHIHGTVNALFCPLHVGATTIMLPKFSAEKVLSVLLGDHEERVSVFMAVPTMYAKLVEEYEKKFKDKQYQIKTYMKNNIRLMVSGSAPLPVPLYNKWYELSGHRILERYGMTEIGMCLSNEYNSSRDPGFVGLPLPGVTVRLAERNDKMYDSLLECSNQNGLIQFNRSVDSDVIGELLVKGKNVFKEYFNKPDKTKEEFTDDGWFITGDMCEYSADKNKFRMLGRKSADIIKSGGYKISALQVETSLITHPSIKECAVVGVSDETWGERVAAVVVPESNCDITIDDIKGWAKDKMPKYLCPTVLKVVDSIPKNAMGKINKKELITKLFTSK